MRLTESRKRKYRAGTPAARLLSALLLWALLLSPRSGTAAAASEAEAEPIRVAVIDTGISTAALPAEALEPGHNFAMEDWDTEDRTGHGTEVAYLIHASAPDAVLIPLVWYDRYASGVKIGGSAELAAAAIYAAVDDYQADIINLSAGMTEENPALKAAVEYALHSGVLVVSPVGNDNLIAPDVCYYPACWQGVIGVGAWDTARNAVADFSQRCGVSLTAPGTALETRNRNGESVRVWGTSYSAALVSGALAVWMSRATELSTRALQRAFLDSCTAAADSGYGLLAAPGSVFCDVPDGTALADAAAAAAERGLLRGTSQAVFSPNQTLTRGMLVTILWRAEGCPAVSTLSGFSDVAPSAYYEAAAAWAAAGGLVRGMGDGTFRPNDGLTWAQLAAVCMRYAGVEEAAEDAWDAAALKWAGAAGILTPSAEASGSRTVTRGEAILAVLQTMQGAEQNDN